MTKIMKLQK